MTLDALKPLLDSGIINESTQQAINEAWETKLVEAKEAVRAELREEFAQRYQHDKQVMVESLDRMVTESLQAELEEFASEKQKLAEDRVEFKHHMTESSTKFNNFMVTKLAEEIKELRDDRKTYENNINKLESFVIKALAEEIQEFEQDKQAVVETKVRLIAGAKTKLAELQQNFIARSAELVRESITKKLESEMTQLKEDIQIARENSFGRKIFETFATEFSATHLNEKADTRNLMNQLADKDRQLAESITTIKKAKQLIENKEREVRVIKESNTREKAMDELLGTLNEEKATLMKNLLESVQTTRLQAAFDKYLPAVLNNAPDKSTKKGIIRETVKEVTGDKAVIKQKVDTEQRDNVIDIKRLAGL